MVTGLPEGVDGVKEMEDFLHLSGSLFTFWHSGSLGRWGNDDNEMISESRYISSIVISILHVFFCLIFIITFLNRVIIALWFVQIILIVPIVSCNC